MKCTLIATLLACTALSMSPLHAQSHDQMDSIKGTSMNQEQLSEKQQAIPPITAFTASGNMERLNAALRQGLDARLTVNEIKEILGQMYAYVGFPRSLNALSEFMRVIEDRKAQGINDPLGAAPSPLPAPERMLEVGTANQTKLSGQPVTGPLFEFSPQIDRYLKEHLFGAIFARDNLSWQDRELATVGALAALHGADSQVQAHMRISRNVGLSEAQLQQLVAVLRERVGTEAADRAETARRSTVVP
ncbi:carboxymuconolactone decarboxylase family protein [Xanthomonas tesorieronis]|uniref:carboxymuconolactone decarboxylase family protein n=1 Tax=Xanthomonas tesorieronis TaxID=3160839 RepID=UPI00351787B5